MKKSTDIVQRIQDFLDEVESNELMDRVYDNDFENYYELTSTLEEARDCAKNGDYKQAMDWMYEFVKTLDTMTADWEGIEDLETYEFDGIVRDLRDMSKSTKKSKMRKGMDIDGVFDDSYQKPHGKYVLHLNLNGDSFYPKYFDDEESFNREVQRAIDNGYTESDWSNYSDNEGLHRRFARDDWGKSAKKSYTPDYMDFRSMVDSIKNTGNHNKVFKE